MRFAEFRTGQVIEAGPYRLEEAEILDFARRYDPQWFHLDAALAAQSAWGSLIASGWQTCAIAMRLAVDAALRDSESFGSPGLDYLKWPNPVRAGDALSLRAEVIGTRRSKSRPSLGMLHWRWQLFNQDGAEVLDLTATSLFDLGRGQVRP
jgi:acyl dehydratase